MWSKTWPTSRPCWPKWATIPMATRPSMVIRIRKCFEIPMTSKSIMTFGKPKERWSNRFRRKMKENEMLLKNRRSDSNLFRQKSDCDCTLKTFKKTFLFHQFELFFHLQIRKTSLFNSSITQCFKSQQKCLMPKISSFCTAK